jgi:large subunit ribosomal protein L24
MKRKFNQIPKLKIRKGDMVMVIAGDSKGAKGKVLEVLVKENRAIVEQVNIVSKHTRPNAKNTQGGIIKQEAPIHISNLMLIDPKGGNPTRVGRKRTEDGKWVRYAKKSGEVIKNG